MSAPTLAAIGVRAGERVRWRPRPAARWVEGTVTGRERDGSIAVRDTQGRARALPIGRLELRAAGPRGGHGWELMADRAARTEQLDLFG